MIHRSKSRRISSPAQRCRGIRISPAGLSGRPHRRGRPSLDGRTRQALHMRTATSSRRPRSSGVDEGVFQNTINCLYVTHNKPPPYKQLIPDARVPPAPRVPLHPVAPATNPPRILAGAHGSAGVSCATGTSTWRPRSVAAITGRPHPRRKVLGPVRRWRWRGRYPHTLGPRTRPPVLWPHRALAVLVGCSISCS